MRESLQVMYKVNRDKTVCEAILFCVWCVVFYTIVNAVNEVQVVFTTNDALFGAVLDQEWEGCVHLALACLLALADLQASTRRSGTAPAAVAATSS